MKSRSICTRRIRTRARKRFSVAGIIGEHAVSVATSVPLSEYLNTSYRPDCDYLEGELLERNVGEAEHNGLQMALSAWLFNRRKTIRDLGFSGAARTGEVRTFSRSGYHGDRRSWAYQRHHHRAAVSMYRNPVAQRPVYRDAGTGRRLHSVRRALCLGDRASLCSRVHIHRRWCSGSERRRVEHEEPRRPRVFVRAGIDRRFALT